MLLVEIVQEVDEMIGIKGKSADLVVVDDIPKDSDPKGPMRIGDLNIDDEGITIEAEILEIETNSGKTKAGKPYKVTKLTLSDKTGPIKLVLWNEQTEQADGLEINDVIKVEAWKVEKGYKGGVFELVYGQFGTINKVEKHIT